MDKFWRQDWCWGAVALLLLGCGLFGLYRPQPVSADRIHLSAVFDDVSGLKADSPVRLSGFVVGEVDTITVLPDLRVRVDMTFDSDLEIPDDSDLRIATSGIFSPPQLNLVLGGGFDLLVDGDEFLYTQSGVDFMRLFKQIIDTAAQDPAAEK